MIDISPEQYKVLKKINKSGSISPESLSQSERDICKFLCDSKLIYITRKCRRNESGELDIFNLYPSEYRINQSGKAQIYTFKSTFYKWWIPVVISIIALIISIAIPLIQLVL